MPPFPKGSVKILNSTAHQTLNREKETKTQEHRKMLKMYVTLMKRNGEDTQIILRDISKINGKKLPKNKNRFLTQNKHCPAISTVKIRQPQEVINHPAGTEN